MLECVCVYVRMETVHCFIEKVGGRRNKDRLKKRMGVANHPQKRLGHEKLEIPEDTRMLAAVTPLGTPCDAQGWTTLCLRPSFSF